jgi:cell division protein ZapA (FtsZ GTPase activity inhibitor)
MTTITIDNQNYELETLSDEAKNQLVSLQFVDAELQRLNAHAAVLQTARVAYVNALKAALPH